MLNEVFEKELRRLVLTAREAPSFNPCSSLDYTQTLPKSKKEKMKNEK
jgi:hypothetical protein